ncbi:hypothetical protein Tco_1151101 [Tanacetum coccineum]
MKGVLSCVDTKERIVVNDKYPKQMVVIRKQLPASFKKRLQDLFRSNADVFAWTYTDMTGIPRIITVGGKPFNTEHKLNEYKHIKLVKQKKRRLGHDPNEAACKELDLNLCEVDDIDVCMIYEVTDIHKKTKTKPKPDKTKHEIEKGMENRSRRRIHLNWPTRTQVNGPS